MQRERTTCSGVQVSSTTLPARKQTMHLHVRLSPCSCSHCSAFAAPQHVCKLVAVGQALQTRHAFLVVALPSSSAQHHLAFVFDLKRAHLLWPAFRCLMHGRLPMLMLQHLAAKGLAWSSLHDMRMLYDATVAHCACSSSFSTITAVCRSVLRHRRRC